MATLVKQEWSTIKGTRSDSQHTEIITWTVSSDANELTSGQVAINAVKTNQSIDIGSSHPTATRAKLREFKHTQLSPNTYYRVEAIYRTPEGGSQGSDGSDGLNGDLRWSYKWITEQREVQHDINGNPITNSALEPFDPPLVEDWGFWELTAKRTESLFDIDKATDFSMSVNSTEVRLQSRFGTVAAGQLYLRTMQPVGELSRDIEGQVPMEYVFWLGYDYGEQLTKQNFWKQHVMDRGYNVYTDRGLVRIRDKENVEMESLVLLNGQGQPINDSDYTLPGDTAETSITGPEVVYLPEEATASTAEAVKLLWKTKKEKDHNELRLF